MKNPIKSVFLIVPPLVRREAYRDDIERPDFESYRLVSPVEPTVVAAELMKRGFEVQLFDLGTYKTGGYEELSNRMVQSKPDAVAMVQSILTFATSHDWNGDRVFELAREANPGCWRILTGTHATNYPGEAVEQEICDFSIKGEVDSAIADLLEAVNGEEELHAQPGISYRQEDGTVFNSPYYPSVDLAELPLPAYELIDDEQKQRYYEMPEYGKIRYPEKNRKYRDIMTSRSCILRCSFCSVAHLRGESQKYRRKPLERVIAEIESALADGVEELHFFDDLFAREESELLDFAAELSRRNLKFPWFVAQGMPLWPLSRDALGALQETGMYRLICPLESGNDRVLKRVVGKLARIDHNENVLAWANELDLEIIGMYVIGMPGETRSEILDTLHFAEAHPEIDYNVFSIATPMVGTRLMKQVTEQNRLEDQDKINKVIKRTVALYRTEAFTEVELGVIRAFDWDRINFSTPERRAKYANMVGVTLEQLDELRQHSKDTFYNFYPTYDGPLSFDELYSSSKSYEDLVPDVA